MALRTFSINPGLGGFGENNADSHADAFCQIVKELTDNAIDAVADNVGNSTAQRIRVELSRFEASPVARTDEIFQVKVTDTGIGMQSIQECVNAFHSSKQVRSQSEQYSTVGRYGIGLTLTLLHAQRLLPGYSAVIRSATASQDRWTMVRIKVNPDRDSIQCLNEEHIPKQRPDESGTMVTVLVPGGRTAMCAWPRLAEYFARFKLSLKLHCSIQVIVPPDLAPYPLMIRPLQEEVVIQGKPDGLEELEDDIERAIHKTSSNGLEKHTSLEDERCLVWKAARHYLGRPVEAKNVAHSVVPIRIRAEQSKSSINTPKLEIAMIVHGPDDEDQTDEENNSDLDDTPAWVTIARLVNRIPLLDTSEAQSCGLVLGVASKYRVWNAFGLEVNYQPDHSSKVPIMSLKDSDKVAPFFKKSTHDRFESSDDESNTNDFTNDFDEVDKGKRRKSSRRHRILPPAGKRLGNILLVLQVHSDPISLPLPSLAKGRLPSDHEEIEQALEVGLMNCLRQLQKSNLNIILTPTELRAVERDVRHIPLVAAAMISVLLSKSDSRRQDLIDTIKAWGVHHEGTTLQNYIAKSSIKYDQHECISMEQLEPLIESRIQFTIEKKQTWAKKECIERQNETSIEWTKNPVFISSGGSFNIDSTQEETVFPEASIHYDEHINVFDRKKDFDDSDYDNWL